MYSYTISCSTLREIKGCVEVLLIMYRAPPAVRFPQPPICLSTHN
jgi:hypothetical protein